MRALLLVLALPLAVTLSACGGGHGHPATAQAARGPCNVRLQAGARLYADADPGGASKPAVAGRAEVKDGSEVYQGARRLLYLHTPTGDDGWAWAGEGDLEGDCPLRIGSGAAEGPPLASTDAENFVQPEPAAAVGGSLVAEAQATTVAELDVDGDKRGDQLLDVLSPDLNEHGLVLARHTPRGWMATLVTALIRPDAHYTYAFDSAIQAGGAVYVVVSALQQGLGDSQEQASYVVFRYGKDGHFAVVFEGTGWRLTGERWHFAAAEGESLTLTATHGGHQLLRWNAEEQRLVAPMIGSPAGRGL